MRGRLPGELSTHTHFFRGEAELDEALAVLAERAAAGRAPSIWCAGCSTGAEPYTIAILCAERGFRAIIHATDLNAEALAAARAARFPELALRFVPAPLRERYFEREGLEHVVVPRVVERVTFEHSDLRFDPLPRPPSAGGAGGWDVILCRNVLIYYEPDAAAAIVARLATVLRRDGVLIMGSTDPLAFRALGSLRAVSAGGVASYAHGELDVPGVCASPDAPPVPPGAAIVRAAPDVSGARAAPDVSGARAAPDVSGARAVQNVAARGASDRVLPTVDLEPATVPSEELARLLAEACAELADHRWDDAEVAFRRAERAAPLAPEPSLYLGVLRRKQGRFDEAAEHLRRAVFLAPRCWIASYLLAGVWDRLGDRSRARLELTRTLDTVRVMGPAAARRAWPAGADIAGLDFDPAEVARACEARLGLGS